MVIQDGDQIAYEKKTFEKQGCNIVRVFNNRKKPTNDGYRF